MSRSHDAIIVGAGFAGLAAAEAAAARGLRTLVLERKSAAGASVHTTGLLCPDSLATLAPPPHVLGRRLDAVDLAGPSGWERRFEREGLGFTPTRTAQLLASLEARAIAAGAEIRHGVNVFGAVEHATGVVVVTEGESLRTDRVLAADGARSAIASSLGAPAQGRMLAGAEVHVEAVGESGLATDSCLLLFHRDWAPGHAAWVFRGCDGLWQVGVLGRASRAYRPALALDAFLRWLGTHRGFRVGSIVERRGGLVPAGGARRLESRRVVLCGDAGGHVSAISAGGVGRAASAGAALGWRLAEAPSAWRGVEAEQARRAGGHRKVLALALDAVSLVADDGLARLVGHPACAWLAREILFRPSPRPSPLLSPHAT